MTFDASLMIIVVGRIQMRHRVAIASKTSHMTLKG
jgi:hypothetical protein